jgi:methionyl-tRNA formyltransferase
MNDSNVRGDSNRFRVGFLGTPIFADRILHKLVTMPHIEVAWVISQPDRPSGRGKRLSPPPVAKTALDLGIPLLQPTSIKREGEAVETFIKENGPVTGAVVVAYGGLLPPSFLHLLHDRCINVHASLLPRWRGAAPIHRAVLAGDSETGICLMKMEEGLDTGPVFSSSPLIIEPHETTGSLHDRLCDLACRAIETDLVAILSGEREACPQSEAGATYANKIAGSECEISWDESASAIERKVLGMSPFPGAFTWFSGGRLRILDAVTSDSPTPNCATPGEVLVIDGADAGLIATGRGTIALRTVQREGRQPVSISDFLRGRSLQKGEILGKKPDSSD